MRDCGAPENREPVWVSQVLKYAAGVLPTRRETDVRPGPAGPDEKRTDPAPYGVRPVRDEPGQDQGM